MKYFITLLTALIFISLPAHAQVTAPLSAADTANFIAAIPDMEAISDRMRAEGKDNILEAAVRPKPGDTDFRPYTKGAAVMKEKFPADYAVLGQSASKHGFTSVENWADTGDKVMMAYVANKMEGKNYQNLVAMANVPPEVKAKLPPQVASQIDQAVTVIKVAQSVPQANKAMVSPHMATIDAWLGREQKKMGLTTQAPVSVMKPAPAPAVAPVKAIP